MYTKQRNNVIDLMLENASSQVTYQCPHLETESGKVKEEKAERMVIGRKKQRWKNENGNRKKNNNNQIVRKEKSERNAWIKTKEKKMTREQLKKKKQK